jgi:hypothetical protein
MGLNCSVNDVKWNCQKISDRKIRVINTADARIENGTALRLNITGVYFMAPLGYESTHSKTEFMVSLNDEKGQVTEYKTVVDKVASTDIGYGVKTLQLLNVTFS